MSHALIEETIGHHAAALGAALAEHPVTLRLKRIEESIREDEEMHALWLQVEGFDKKGSCGTGGGCGSGGCGTKKKKGEDHQAEAIPPSQMELMERFGAAPLLQEYVQVKHRFYALVDQAFIEAFQAAYGKSWMGEPVVGVEAEPLAEPIPGSELPLFEPLAGL